MRKIKKLILNIPFVSIFTKEKIVKSKLLNRMGLQPFRMKCANIRYQLRKHKIKDFIKEEATEVKDKGITKIDNFLNENHFNQVATECKRLRDINEWDTIVEMGPNVIKNISLKSKELNQFPGIKKLIEDDRIKALFEAAEKRSIDIYGKNYYILLQYLEQGYEDTFDPESALHSDTFFNTHKAWLYIDDVKNENGPFIYVSNSHKANSTYRRNKEFEYSKSKNPKGSRRIPPEELKEQGLQETIFTCDKNTFVMANTLGYHRRLNGKGGHDRLTFAISARYNPFF